MRKNLLIGASALAVLAFAGTANAANIGADTTYNSGNAFPNEANAFTGDFTATIDAGYSVTLGGAVTTGTNNQGTLLINGTVVQGANILGTNGVAVLKAVTVGTAGTLTTGDAIDATTITNSGTLNAATGTLSGQIVLAGGTLNLTGATLADGDNVSVTGDVILNATSGTTDTISIADDKTLTITALETAVVQGAINAANAGKGMVAFDSTTNDKTFILDAEVGNTTQLAKVSVAKGDTLTAAAQNIKAASIVIDEGAIVTTTSGNLTGAVALNGTLTTATGTIGAVTMGDAAVLNIGGDLTNGTIDAATAGKGTINVTASGALDAAIGATKGVGSIVVNEGATLTTGANNISATAITLGNAAKTSTATLAVTGNSTITGKIDGDAAGEGKMTVAGGTLTTNGNIGSTNALASIDIGNGGVLTANTNNNTIAATTISFSNANGIMNVGNGNVTGKITATGNNQGFLHLLGTGSVSGTIGANGALLDEVNVGNGTTTNTVNINDSVAATNFNVKDKATAVINKSALTIEGITDVAGTLNVGSNAVTHTGVVKVAATGTLDLGTGSINAGATAFTTAAGATIKSNISGVDASAANNKSGKITATADAAATFDGGTKIHLTVDGYVANNAQFTIVGGAAATTGDFALNADSQITDSSALLTFSSVTAGNDLIVKATRSATNTYNAVTTGAGVAAGTALEAEGARIGAIAVGTRTAAQTSLFSTIGKIEQQATTAAVSAAVNELAPEVNGAGVEGALAAVNQVAGTVSNRMEAARGYASLGNTGVASGDEWVKGYGVWGQFFGAYAEQDKHDNIDGYEATTLGFALGGDKQFTDNLTAGIALSYANADVDSTDASVGNNTEVDSYGVSLYGTYNNGSPWYVEGQLGLAFNEYDSTRKIGFAGLTAKGDFDGMQYGAKVGAGYTYDMGSTLVTPMASLQYTRIELDSYTETGAGGASLKVNEQDYDVLTSELGAKLAVKPFEAAGWTVAPEVHAAWTYDIVKDEAEVTASFTGGTTSFVTKGKEPSEHGLKLGLGVDVANGENVTVSVNYDAELKDEYLGHVGALKVRYDF